MRHIYHTWSLQVDVYMQLGYLGIRREMDESTILASMEVHYFDQTIHPSKLEIGHRISRVGNKSFDFLAGIFHAENKNLTCSAIFRLVAYSYNDACTIPVHKKIRERCRPIE